MPLTNEILTEIWNREYNYKGIRVNIFGIPRFKKYSRRTLRSTIDRLARDQLIEKNFAGLVLSPVGKKYIARKLNSLKQFEFSGKVSSKRELLLMFDILECKKAEREWLRFHLKKFNFIMVQKSVWVGPSPLPKDFQLYLKEIKIEECVKKFKLAQPLN